MNSKDKIRPIINAVSPISEAAMQKLEPLVQFSTITKGSDLTAVGQSNSYEYFVIDGICKSFLFNPEGEEITLSFFMSNAIISPYITRVKNGKSLINLKALTELTVASMNAAAFEKLMVDDLEIRRFGNTVLRNELLEKVQKEIALASSPAKIRLQNLRKKFPNIENSIPHADIASYLGITTISLSRLRSRS